VIAMSTPQITGQPMNLRILETLFIQLNLYILVCQLSISLV